MIRWPLWGCVVFVTLCLLAECAASQKGWKPEPLKPGALRADQGPR